MAANKHTPNRARIRKRQAQRNRHHPPQRQGASRRRSVAHAKATASKALDPERLQEALKARIRGLEVVLSTVIVSVSALRRQNADIDEDIARVLERSAADRLDIEIERLQAFVTKEADHRDV